MEEKKELIRFASRPIIIMLMIIASGVLLFYDMTGNTIAAAWCWLTLSLVCEWVLEKKLSDVITTVKAKLKK